MPNIIASKRETILAFFDASRQHEFLIPEYQRPYEWRVDEVTDLFYDLKNFNDDENSRKTEDPNYKADDYFLGTIIYFQNANGQREIVDGQQRIISLFLLFRAIYEEISTNAILQNFARARDIERIIWKTDNVDGNIISRDQLLIDTEAISDNSKNIFVSIISEGKAEDKLRDSYSVNYRTIQELIRKELLIDEGNFFKNFVVRLLDATYVLPIESTTFDATLEIFERINDRGRQLTETDIFKSKIYVELDAENRNDFISRWKDLEEKVTSIGETMRTLFIYQMFYIRAKNNDISAARRISLRRFFLNEKLKNGSLPLKNSELISDLEKIFELVNVMKKRGTIAGKLWSRNFEITKLLDILWKAPNDWWRYSAVVYYLANVDKENFPNEFVKFLRKLVATISIFYSLNLTRSEKKRNLLILNVNSVNSIHPIIETPEITLEAFANDDHLTKKILKTFLHELAYGDPDQKAMLPVEWEVEYIFPKKFTPNYPPESEVIYMRKAVDKFGNLAILDKKPKLSAIPGFFQRKQMFYKNTSIAFTKKLADLEDFGIDTISERTQAMFETLIELWYSWVEGYDQ